MAPRKEGGFPPKRRHRISLKAAAALTRRYRNAAPASEKTGLFDANAVRDLLKQPGCVGFRYYHGLDAKGVYHIVLVGVDRTGADIATSPGAVLLEDHFPCPPWCPTSGPLNSD